MEELVCYSKASLITKTIHDNSILNNNLEEENDTSQYLLEYRISISNKEKQEKLRKKLLSVNNFIPMNVWLSKGIKEAITSISEKNQSNFN